MTVINFAAIYFTSEKGRARILLNPEKRLLTIKIQIKDLDYGVATFTFVVFHYFRSEIITAASRTKLNLPVLSASIAALRLSDARKQSKMCM